MSTAAFPTTADEAVVDIRAARDPQVRILEVLTVTYGAVEEAEQKIAATVEQARRYRSERDEARAEAAAFRQALLANGLRLPEVGPVPERVTSLSDTQALPLRGIDWSQQRTAAPGPTTQPLPTPAAARQAVDAGPSAPVSARAAAGGHTPALLPADRPVTGPVPAQTQAPAPAAAAPMRVETTAVIVKPSFDPRNPAHNQAAIAAAVEASGPGWVIDQFRAPDRTLILTRTVPATGAAPAPAKAPTAAAIEQQNALAEKRKTSKPKPRWRLFGRR